MNYDLNNSKYYPFIWGISAATIGSMFMLIRQVNFYATESLGLSITVVSSIIMIARLLDGVSDIFAGMIIDKTKSRMGKARPYELFIIPSIVFIILLYSIPNIDFRLKGVWFFVAYFMVTVVSMTFCFANEPIYLRRSTTSKKLQVKSTAANAILTVVFAAAVTIALPFFMDTWGRQPGGWTRIMLLFCGIMVIPAFLRFFLIKELPQEELDKAYGTTDERPVEKMSVKESLGHIFRNKYILIVAAVMFLATLVNNIDNAVMAYFYEYYLGDLTKMSLVSAAGFFASFTFLLFPYVAKKWGGMTFVKVGLVLAIIGNLIKYISGTNIVGIVIGNIIAYVPGTSSITVLGNMFVIECIDYGQWKTGARVEGTISCVTGFAKKMGQGLGVGLAGIMLAASGFIESASRRGLQQPASALTTIRLSFSVYEAIICAIMLFLLHFYDLDRNYKKIKDSLK